MTKRQVRPKWTQCQNPDHYDVRPTHPSEFAQAPGRHRPSLYCSRACATWVKRHYVRVDGALVLAEATTYLTPVGEGRSFPGAVGAATRLAEAAGLPKGSPVRTAMLTGAPKGPEGAGVDVGDLADRDDGDPEHDALEDALYALPEAAALELADAVLSGRLTIGQVRSLATYPKTRRAVTGFLGDGRVVRSDPGEGRTFLAGRRYSLARPSAD